MSHSVSGPLPKEAPRYKIGVDLWVRGLPHRVLAVLIGIFVYLSVILHILKNIAIIALPLF